MKKRLLVSMVALAAVLVLVLAACQVGPAQAKGEAVFTVSDAAADMGAVSNVGLTIDGLRVRSESGAWTTVNVEEQTFMLLDLRDQMAAELLASAELAAGTYDRLELQVSKAVVIDASGQHEAKIPGNKLQLVGTMEVQSGATATADFDFLADKSLHVTGNGHYIFAPVVLLETRTGADVEVQADGEVKVSGGSVSTSTEIGMDVHGNADAGLRIAPDAVLSLSASGKIVQTAGPAMVVGAIKAVDTANGTVTVLTGAGTEVVLKANEQSKIELGGSLIPSGPSGLLGLNSKVGTQVQANYDAGTAVVTEMQAQASAQANAQASAQASALANAEATVTGTLVGVNTLSGTITVVSDAGAQLVLNVGANAQVLVDGAVSSVAGLAANVGSQVVVTYNAETNVTSEVAVNGNAEVTVVGTLKAVDEVASSITVTTSAGVDIVLDITASTEILVGGSPSTMAALKAYVGSQVSVTYNAETMVASKVVVLRGLNASATVTGTLTSADAVAGTVTILTEAGTEITLNLTSQTTASISPEAPTSPASQADATVAADTTATAEAGAASAADLAANVGASVTAESDAAAAVAADTTAIAEAGAASAADLAANVGASVTAEFDVQANTATSIKLGS